MNRPTRFISLGSILIVIGTVVAIIRGGDFLPIFLIGFGVIVLFLGLLLKGTYKIKRDELLKKGVKVE